MAWLFILIAGSFEVVWAIGLKYTDGFTRLWPSVVTAVAIILSMLFLAQAARLLPIGTAYAVWTGIGAAGTAVLGIVLFGESRDIARVGSILVIIAGIVSLSLTSGD